jgi:hypothetical protein
MKNNFVLVAFLNLFLTAYPSLAQTTGTQAPAPSTALTKTENSSPLVSKMTLDELQHRVQVLGFQCERGSTDGKPDNYFTFRAEGRKVGGKVATPELIEFFVYYSDGASLATVNEWNNTQFGSTAYVDADGNAVLESELILTGGVTEENVNTFITNFRDSAVNYARFILDHKKDKTVKPTQ